MDNQNRKGILKGKLAYHLSKIAPMNFSIPIKLVNGLKYMVRARTMDRSVLKEVWIKNIYNKHGVKVNEGDTVVDIGAHIGVFSVYAAELSKTGSVYAFEPFINNYRMLEKHKIINHKENLFIYNKGISDREGTQTLFLSPDNNTGGHSLHLKNHSDRKAEIQTITLSGFCDREKIHKIDFLKMDCEGAEFEILRSDESILQKVNKIVMECHPYGNNSVEDIVSILERNGFKVVRESNNSPNGIEMLYAMKPAGV
jgi:FkbM family methyltransferase